MLGCTAGDLAFSLNLVDVYDAILQEGIRAEMLKSVLESANEEMEDEEEEKESAGDLKTFLKTKLRFEEVDGQERCIDTDGNGIMMAWECVALSEVDDDRADFAPAEGTS